jgi:hypothetical protein
MINRLSCLCSRYGHSETSLELEDYRSLTGRPANLLVIRLKGLRQAFRPTVTVCWENSNVDGRSRLAWPGLRCRLRRACLDLG